MTTATLRVAITGDASAAQRWARALRGLEDVAVTIVPPDREFDTACIDAGAQAAVLALPLHDVAAVAKRALLGGRNVLVAGPVALATGQLMALETVARARGRVLLFDLGSLGDERMQFVRRMTAGAQALWKPRYVRSQRGAASSRASLDELAVADIQLALGVLGGAPSRVSALAPRIDDESGSAGAAMVTLAFDGGPAARIDVSMLEPGPRHELTVVCDGRSVTFDACNTAAPLLIQSTARHRVPGGGGPWNETISESPATEGGDRLPRAAELFAEAARRNDAESTNVGEVALATLVWEAARDSIGRGGEQVGIAPIVQSGERPVLQLIKGKGRGTGSRSTPTERRLQVVG